MGRLFFVAYGVAAVVQIWAGIEGMQLYFGIGGVIAVVLLFVAYAIPFVGMLGVAFLAYYGARHGWQWEWWQALLLVAPAILLMLVACVMGGLAISVQRVGPLISLHHYLATPTPKTGNKPSKSDAFRK